LEIQDAN